MTNIYEADSRQLVMDDEFIARPRRMFEGITRHNLDEEVALIKANTPRGNFLKAKHTRRTFREHWSPGIFSRDNYDTCQAKGKTIEQSYRQKATQILDEHVPPSLSASIEAELEHIMRRYLPDFHFES
jgi:trimethylamine:corrinoid methyltransferase-like protein